MKIDKNLVSIITPTFNSEKYILETIKSVLNQSYINWEMIITDDCSTDNTYDLVKKFTKNDDRIIIHKLKINSGSAIARQNSLSYSKGNYIAFLDSDDTWLPNKLITQLKFMTYNNVPISFTSYFLMNEKGVSLNKTIKSIEKVNYHQYLKNTIIGMSTSMIDTSKVIHIVFKNEYDIFTGEDVKEIPKKKLVEIVGLKKYLFKKDNNKYCNPLT